MGMEVDVTAGTDVNCGCGCGCGHRCGYRYRCEGKCGHSCMAVRPPVGFWSSKSLYPPKSPQAAGCRDVGTQGHGDTGLLCRATLSLLIVSRRKLLPALGGSCPLPGVVPALRVLARRVQRGWLSHGACPPVPGRVCPSCAHPGRPFAPSGRDARGISMEPRTKPQLPPRRCRG